MIGGGIWLALTRAQIILVPVALEPFAAAARPIGRIAAVGGFRRARFALVRLCDAARAARADSGRRRLKTWQVRAARNWPSAAGKVVISVAEVRDVRVPDSDREDGYRTRAAQFCQHRLTNIR